MVEVAIQVRARGNFRYKFCDFPPLNLNFRRSQLEGTLFENQNKLKLVGHCKITRRYEQSVLREYLAYRLLNAMTDLSFRVRLLEVTWVDSDERRGRMVRSAFLIDDAFISFRYADNLVAALTLPSSMAIPGSPVHRCSRTSSVTAGPSLRRCANHRPARSRRRLSSDEKNDDALACRGTDRPGIGNART